VVQKLNNIWQGVCDSINIALWGKKIAVIGDRRVGKTHFIEFITTGEIVPEYKQGISVCKTSKNVLRIGEIEFPLKSSLDVLGDSSGYALWKKIFVEADYAFYLFRADKLINGDDRVKQRIIDDLMQIMSWQRSAGAHAGFFKNNGYNLAEK